MEGNLLIDWRIGVVVFGVVVGGGGRRGGISRRQIDLGCTARPFQFQLAEVFVLHLDDVGGVATGGVLGQQLGVDFQKVPTPLR